MNLSENAAPLEIRLGAPVGSSLPTPSPRIALRAYTGLAIHTAGSATSLQVEQARDDAVALLVVTALPPSLPAQPPAALKSMATM